MTETHVESTPLILLRTMLPGKHGRIHRSGFGPWEKWSGDGELPNPALNALTRAAESEKEKPARNERVQRGRANRGRLRDDNKSSPSVDDSEKHIDDSLTIKTRPLGDSFTVGKAF